MKHDRYFCLNVFVRFTVLNCVTYLRGGKGGGWSGRRGEADEGAEG